MPFEFAAAAILFLAAFTFSFAGFGFPWVALPLLSLVMPLRDAVVFHYPFVLALVLYHAWRFRGHIAWKRHWAILVGAALGMPIGAWVLFRLPESGLKRCLAVFVVLSVITLGSEVGRRFAQRLTASVLGGGITGLISGWLQGAYATGGPPAVLYIMARTQEPKEAKGFLGVYFTFIVIGTAALYGAGGLFDAHWLKMSLYYSPAVLAGVVLGAWAFKHASTLWFTRAIYVLLTGAAVLLWVRAGG